MVKSKRVKLRLFGREPVVLLWDIVKYIFLFCFVIICIYPFYYVAIYSVSDPALVNSGITFWPRGFTLKNYLDVLELTDMKVALKNSVLRTVLGTLISVVTTATLAYLMTREMYFKKFVFRYFITTMYVGAGLIPWYLTMVMYGLNNTFTVYILPGAINVFNMILVKNFIEQLPPSLEESAEIEGAGFWTILTRIIFPLSKPILATIAVYCMVGQWNAWTDNYFLNTDVKYMTLQLVLRKALTQARALLDAAQKGHIDDKVLQQAMTLTPKAVQMTAIMITCLPIMLVYPIAQKYFVKGLMVGAVKG